MMLEIHTVNCRTNNCRTNTSFQVAPRCTKLRLKTRSRVSPRGELPAFQRDSPMKNIVFNMENIEFKPSQVPLIGTDVAGNDTFRHNPIRAVSPRNGRGQKRRRHFQRQCRWARSTVFMVDHSPKSPEGPSPHLGSNRVVGHEDDDIPGYH